MRRATSALLAAICIVGCSESATSVGQAAPEVEVESMGINSDSLKLSSLKGKVVILDFWATWCGPCRKMMPFVDELYRKNKDKGLTVVAVTNEDRATVAEFLKMNSFDMPIYRDPFGLAWQAYGVDAIPHTVVIDRDGKIVYDEIGADAPSLKEAVTKAMG